MTKFQLGDMVEWTSSSAGSTRKKTGEVVEVIAAGIRPTKGLSMPGGPRDHESYIVRATAERRKGTRLYWSRVSVLRKVL